MASISTSDHFYHYESTGIAIDFSHEDERLHVTIDTDTHHLESTDDSAAITAHLTALLQNPEVMKTNGDGKPYTDEEVAMAVKTWAERWFKGNPYSAFAIYDKERVFVGVVALDRWNDACDLDTALLIDDKHWHKGHGKAAAAAMQQYVLETIKIADQLDGKPAKSCSATSRVGSYACKILTGLGVPCTKEDVAIEGYTENRNCFEMKLA